MSHTSSSGWNRWGTGKIILTCFLILGAGFLVYALIPEAKTNQQSAYHKVKRSNFLITIVEGGTLESVNDVVIRNEVEGTSRITYIIPEGTYVKKGDLLVELDTGEAEDNVNQQELAYEKAKAGLIAAEKDLEIQKSVIQSTIDTADLKKKFAEIDLEKYLKGDRIKELRTAEIAISTETSKLLLAKDNLDWSEKLFQQGFETKNVVDEGRNKVLELNLKVESAQTNLWVLTNFEHPKLVQQYESDLSEAIKELQRAIAQGEGKLALLEADLITQSNSLHLTSRKLLSDRKQLENSKIYAPQDGLVVYAMVNSRYSSQSMIEEGATVRNRQELIKLPDTSAMKVEIKVHESHVGKVDTGQPAFVVLDPLPDVRYRAQVTKVAVLPDTQSRFGNPNLKVYKTEILITDPMEDIKPGVSARAEIVITNIPGALTVPIQAITTLKGQTVAFVRDGNEDVPTPVEVGMYNTKSIEIKSGLNEGDLVLLSPPYDAEEKDLGGAIITDGDEIPKVKLNPNPPDSQPTLDQPGRTERQGPDEGGGRPPGGGSGINREEMMKRFDKNGDGTLDDEERGAMRESMGSRRPRDGGGNRGGDRDGGRPRVPGERSSQP